MRLTSSVLVRETSVGIDLESEIKGYGKRERARERERERRKREDEVRTQDGCAGSSRLTTLIPTPMMKMMRHTAIAKRPSFTPRDCREA